MLKIRIIPTLLIKESGLVKGVGFNSWRRIGTTLPAIKVYNRRQVDELIVLDISATPNQTEPDLDEIQAFSSDCFVPLTVGGGIRTIEHIKELLRVGADKVSINTACYTNPELISLAAEHFGTQCIVVSIDAKQDQTGHYSCYSHCGQQKENISAVDLAKKIENLGAGEIIVNNVSKDGSMEGYDLDLIQQVSAAVNIPVIASGGAGSYEDFRRAIQVGGAQAVSAASMFHFTEQTPLEAKNYLKEFSIPVRNL